MGTTSIIMQKTAPKSSSVPFNWSKLRKQYPQFHITTLHKYPLYMPSHFVQFKLAPLQYFLPSNAYTFDYQKNGKKFVTYTNSLIPWLNKLLFALALTLNTLSHCTRFTHFTHGILKKFLVLKSSLPCKGGDHLWRNRVPQTFRKWMLVKVRSSTVLQTMRRHT